MDGHCEGCFYKVFEDDTKKYVDFADIKIWGFCGYKDIIE